MRMILIYIVMTISILIILIKVVYIQFSYDLKSNKKKIESVEYSPMGTIYSSDGKVLSTSIYKYDIYVDLVVISNNVFNANIDALSDSLSSMWSKPKLYYKNRLITARRNRKKYFLIKRGLSFSENNRLKKFPIFNMGRYKGGFISDVRMERVRPYGNLAKRTIGFYNQNGAKVGLEGGLKDILKPKRLKIMKLKEEKDEFNNSFDEIQSVQDDTSSDVVTTININMQNLVDKQLRKSLNYFEAAYGCVVIMEVKTGAIRAIVNLTRNKGKYVENYNYAVGELMEPGSTFKLPSLLVALEDKKIDTNDIIDTQKGKYKLYSKIIKDTKKGGYGKISVGKVFELSSNIGIVKIINNNYNKTPKAFIDNLYDLGLASKLGIVIPGEGNPKIPTLDDNNWSGISLAQISYGYELLLTPLQILTFYNGIANNGLIIKPIFVESIINRNGQVNKTKTPVVIKSSMCSKDNLAKLKSLLKRVVDNGTASNIDNNIVSLSGKTGTAQINYWKKDNKEYISSFVGYFPSESPLYSCIIVISKPNSSKGYYGSIVAAPVFGNIAKKIYSSIPKEFKTNSKSNKVNIKRVHAKYDMYYRILDKLKNNKMPNFKGMAIMDVVSMIENKGVGVKVKFSGSGKVKSQHPKPGDSFNNKVIILK